MDKKQKIILSAKELFSEYGYKKVSMDEIATAAGITKKTVYNYIKDKEEILKCILNDELNNMKNMMNKIDEENIPFENKIHKIIYLMVDYKKNSKILSMISKEAEHLSASITKKCLKILDDNILSTIEERLKQSVKDGDIKPCNTEFAAFVIYKVYVALMFEWDKPLDEKEMTTELISVLKTGLFN